MSPEKSQPAACTMPSPYAPVQNTVVIDSETESESELKSQPDKEFDYIIENQLGLPEYQHGYFRSSPPPVEANVKNELNNSDSEFFSISGLQKLTLQFAKQPAKFKSVQTKGSLR
jgi:hypothetical protein